MSYQHIFSPGHIGTLITKNRIKYAATETNFNTSDGFVTDREIAYMEAQARGGAGIVTTQGAYVDVKGEGKGFRGMMGIADDCFIPGLAGIAEAIKRHGALAACQILHCGREGGVNLDYCLMPSVVPQRLSYFKPPREMTTAEIKQSIKDHVAAARRAVAAGYDMLEISGIVGYLISTFISRYTNKRQDEYGGETVKGRCRLMVEVLQAIKAEIGQEVPVGIRLCGWEILDDRGGNTLDESVESFRIAEEAGADYVSVTVGWHESSLSVITRDVPMGHWLPIAERVKKAVGVPVMMAFRQFLPEIPERAISSGAIDFWEACRPMIADPELPVKAAQGRENEIAPCIACNLCFSRLYYHQPIMCSVRPSLGHEQEATWGYHGFAQAGKRKRIGVVGGGPAGLQCAAVAAQRGHEVILWEQRESVGGNIQLVARVDEGDDELLRPIAYLENTCRKAGVEMHVGVECTRQVLREQGLDALVVARGSAFKTLPGPFFRPPDIIREGRRPGKRVLVVGGDGVGLAVAVYLLRHGEFDLTLIEESGRLGRDVNPFYLWRYLKLFKERSMNFMTRASLIRSEGGTASISSPKGEKRVEIDDIIMAEREVAGDWKSELAGTAPAVYAVGDAKRPRRLHNAIHDGYLLGMEL